jgi:hypothetical protein
VRFKQLFLSADGDLHRPFALARDSTFAWKESRSSLLVVLGCFCRKARQCLFCPGLGGIGIFVVYLVTEVGANVFESMVKMRCRRSLASGSCGPNSTLTSAVKCKGFDHCPGFNPSDDTSRTEPVPTNRSSTCVPFTMPTAESKCSGRNWLDLQRELQTYSSQTDHILARAFSRLMRRAIDEYRRSAISKLESLLEAQCIQPAHRNGKDRTTLIR